MKKSLRRIKSYRGFAAIVLAIIVVLLVSVWFMTYNQLVRDKYYLYKREAERFRAFMFVKAVNVAFWDGVRSVIAQGNDDFREFLKVFKGDYSWLENKYRATLITLAEAMGEGDKVSLKDFSVDTKSSQIGADKKIGISSKEMYGEIILHVKVKFGSTKVTVSEKKYFRFINILPPVGKFTLFVKNALGSTGGEFFDFNNVKLKKCDSSNCGVIDSGSILTCFNASSPDVYFDEEPWHETGWIYLGERNGRFTNVILNMGDDLEYGEIGFWYLLDILKARKHGKYAVEKLIKTFRSKSEFNSFEERSITLPKNELPPAWRNVAGFDVSVYMNFVGFSKESRRIEESSLFKKMLGRSAPSSKDDYEVSSSILLFGNPLNPTPTRLFGSYKMRFFRFSFVSATPRGGGMSGAAGISYDESKKLIDVGLKALKNFNFDSFKSALSRDWFEKLRSACLKVDYNNLWYQIVPVLRGTVKNKYVVGWGDKIKKSVKLPPSGPSAMRYQVKHGSEVVLDVDVRNFDFIRAYKKKVVWKIKDLNGNGRVDDEFALFCLKEDEKGHLVLKLWGGIVEFEPTGRRPLVLPKGWRPFVGKNDTDVMTYGGVLVAPRVVVYDTLQDSNLIKAPFAIQADKILFKDVTFLPAYVLADKLYFNPKKFVSVYGGVACTRMIEAGERDNPSKLMKIPNMSIYWNRIYNIENEQIYNSGMRLFFSKTTYTWIGDK